MSRSDVPPPRQDLEQTKSVPLRDLWSHLNDNQQSQVIDRLTIMLQRQLLEKMEGVRDE